MKNIIIVVAAIIVLGGAAFVFARNSDDEPAAENTQTTQPATNGTDSQNAQDNTPAEGDTNTQNTTDEVEIENMSFGPSSITVKKGTTVTWTNKDSVQHDVSPDDGDSAAFSGSELLSKDESYNFTFNTPGTYAYHCGPHPQMTATVTVTE